jgi:hypothetical protein
MRGRDATKEYAMSLSFSDLQNEAKTSGATTKSDDKKTWLEGGENAKCSAHYDEKNECVVITLPLKKGCGYKKNDNGNYIFNRLPFSDIDVGWNFPISINAMAMWKPEKA